MNPTEAALVAQIKAAFGDVQPPKAEDMLQPVYAGNEDMYEMMMAFLGLRCPSSTCSGIARASSR